MIKIRKLRKYLRLLRNSGEVSKEDYVKFRRYAKSGIFASLKHLKDYVASMKKEEKTKLAAEPKAKKEKAEKNKRKSLTKNKIK